MSIRYAVLLVPVVVSLVGCASPAPVAGNFPLSYQKVARTAHHWDVVAEDVVTQTLTAIADKQQLQGRGLFVAPARNTTFNVAFRDFLITRFVERGADVSVCRPTDSKPGFALDRPDIEVKYETQLIGHGTIPNYAPGRFTALAAGVAVLRNIAESDLSRGEENAVGIAFGALADWGLGHVAAPTRTEIVVTTTIAENNRFVMRRSDIYYVPESDARLFLQRVNHPSACLGETSVAAAEPAKDVDRVERARREQFLRDMRRVNPSY